MKNFKEFLIEKTFNIQLDVDYIYNKSGLSELSDMISIGDTKGVNKFLAQGKTFLSLSSNTLKSRHTKQASKIKPVLIEVGVFDGGSFYDTKLNFIQISINKQALKHFMSLGLDVQNAEFDLRKVSNRFLKEFKPATLKGTISHELTHWIDDVLHGEFLTKRVNVARERGIKGLAGKHNNVNHTEFEVNSQIHAVKEIKRNLGKREFDKLNWIGLIQQKSSLMANFDNFKTPDDYQIFMKKFVSRLHREQLLAKGLKKIPTFSEMRRILNTY